MHVRFAVAEPGLVVLTYVPSAHVAHAVHWFALVLAAVCGGFALRLGALNVPVGHAVHTRSFCAEAAVLMYVPAAQLLNARQVRLAVVLN